MAGPLLGGLQRCTRCGEVLSDYRDAMVPEADAEKPLTGWAVGAHVDVEEGFPRSFAVTDDLPNCEVRHAH